MYEMWYERLWVMESAQIPVSSPRCRFCTSRRLSRMARNLSNPTTSTRLKPYMKLLESKPVTPMTNVDAIRHAGLGCWPGPLDTDIPLQLGPDNPSFGGGHAQKLPRARKSTRRREASRAPFELVMRQIGCFWSVRLAVTRVHSIIPVHKTSRPFFLPLIGLFHHLCCSLVQSSPVVFCFSGLSFLNSLPESLNFIVRCAVEIPPISRSLVRSQNTKDPTVLCHLEMSKKQELHPAELA